MKVFDMSVAFDALKDNLQELVADKLDVNRNHIEITKLNMEVVAEVPYEDAEDTNDTYYQFAYRYKHKNTYPTDYDDEVWMYWMHTWCGTDANRYSDIVLTEAEYDEMFGIEED